MIKLFLALGLLISASLSAQSKEEIDSVQKLFKARDYTWVDYDNNIFKMRKAFSSKWGLFSWNIDENQLLPMEYDSVSFMADYEPFSIVKRKGKYGIFLLPFEIPDAAKRVNCIYDELRKVEEETHDSQPLLLAKKEGKWGQIDWLDEFEILPFIYPSAQAVPLQYIDSWANSIIKASREKLNSDLVFLDAGNGDGVFKARNIDSQKWGMYQYLDEIKTLIPASYDSIDFFSWNRPFTGVYNNGKVGIYTSAWSVENAQETVPCIYDDFKIIEGNRDYFLAVMQKGKWSWMDWREGKLIGAWVNEMKDLKFREDDAW
jgi:hypothetical protein